MKLQAIRYQRKQSNLNKDARRGKYDRLTLPKRDLSLAQKWAIPIGPTCKSLQLSKHIIRITMCATVVNGVFALLLKRLCSFRTIPIHYRFYLQLFVVTDRHWPAHCVYNSTRLRERAQSNRIMPNDESKCLTMICKQTAKQKIYLPCDTQRNIDQ